MKEYYADLHVHIGSTETGKAVKITASKTLTLKNILIEASDSKGIDIVGIIDSHVPEVQSELRALIDSKEAAELPEGGVRYRNTTLLLGTELEIYDPFCKGPLHVLAFFPYLENMERFSEWLKGCLKNINLSSQRVYVHGKVLQEQVKKENGLFIPAHIFTPHRSVYGSGVEKSIKEVFEPKLIDAVELGLSSNTEMADGIAELHGYSFVSNSDAHSLPKMAREYQKLQLKSASFEELKKALKNEGGRRILANYGLNPFLGKYYLTTCEGCGIERPKPDGPCPNCGKTRITKGVSTRIAELSDAAGKKPERPPYIHQVPLQFIPGIGPKTLTKLKEAFGTEMTILHHTEGSQLSEIIPQKTADLILAARNGTLALKAGGGGIYGKVDQKVRP
ncbi:endonuclease Q family protein [Metabacillus sp. GX 13764]|uniref:endonuclease Q family protein n=1 Tax=Metabacillus kandeliae TaxID=2900151 RepID=UPI001E28E5FF|nr:endonuclease Q family protein [Metabacillus kandeliae]MCD7033280.1 endonuclease Q family protein [Metabacillus kandeliae]